ncbi:MAG: xanthine dehydrogenase accessory protein XdhC [Pseudomonadota bacterium]
MSFDLARLTRAVDAHTRVARIVIAYHKGSTPREAGTAMLVWRDGQSGSIGGGALEYRATESARQMLAQGATARVDNQALGPALAQCCGGAVTLVTEVFDGASLRDLASRAVGGHVSRPVSVTSTPPPAFTGDILLSGGWLCEAFGPDSLPVWVYGAGHVGRALAAVLAPVPEVAVTVIDTAAERLAGLPPETEGLVAAEPARAVRHAPPGAFHYVMTYSHAHDLEICAAILGRSFRFCGLIGSATKWARFRKRLLSLGHSESAVARITCPIGDPSLGKAPQAIALGVSVDLLRTLAHPFRTEAAE